ncbi:Wadjet anti-phage system protein JetD domain-containing protein [Mesorhizobium sp. f-mel]
MSRRGFSTISSLVDDLLTRHERSPAAQNLLASIDNNGFANMDLRDTFDEELAALERAGGIELVHTGPKTERRVTSARLKDAGVLYRKVERRPAGELASQAVSELRSQPRLPAGATSLIDDAVAAWTRGVSHIGIGNGDGRTLAHVIGLAIAIHERMSGNPQGEQDFRTFSRLTVGDSKALEKNVRQVAAAMAKIYPNMEDQTRLDPEELLASAGIRRLPQPILLHGDVSLDGRSFPAMPYVGIPTDCAGGIGLLTRPNYVLTIENFTSFVRHIREVARSERALVIYSGGFPSRPTLATITRLAAQAQVPTFHWGDMDAGGIRIFQHLERHLANVDISLRPHMMDTELLRRFGRPAQIVTNPIGDVNGSMVADLANFLSSNGLVHEQEEFDPRSPIRDA